MTKLIFPAQHVRLARIQEGINHPGTAALRATFKVIFQWREHNFACGGAATQHRLTN